MTKLDKDLVEICADAFMAAWAAVHRVPSLVYDSLESAVDNPEIVGDVWDTIRRKYDAREYPFGVFSFPGDPTMKIRQRVLNSISDHRYPELVELFKTRLKSDVFA